MYRLLLIVASCDPSLATVYVRQPRDAVDVPCVAHRVDLAGLPHVASRVVPEGPDVEARLGGARIEWHWLGDHLAEAVCVEGEVVTWSWAAELRTL